MSFGTFRRFICRECGRLMGVIYMSREEPPNNVCGKCDPKKETGEPGSIPSEEQKALL